MNDDERPLRILVVEDNDQTRDIVRRTLESAGYDTVCATTGQEALELVRRSGLPHLVVADIHMPQMSGVEFSRRIRSFSDVPVIILTADDNPDVEIDSINEFADDFIVKPVEPPKLLARVRRILSRIDTFDYTTQPVIVIDDNLQINLANQEVIAGGEVTHLTPLEAKLLHILVRNAGQTVTNSFLLRRLWGMENPPDDRIGVYVHRLRRKLEPGKKTSSYIIVYRGVGYSFVKKPPSFTT